MFKKQFKISNSHQVAGKDKKKLKETLLKLGYELTSVETFLDDKQFDGQELSQDKLQGSKVQLLSRGKTPLMFTQDAGNQGTLYLPTIYLLFQLEKLPSLRVYLKQGVEQYLFNGADLMWPGVRSINREDFKQYEIAVIYAQNELSADGTSYVPVGVGRMLASKIPEELKGRAVEVSHYLYDELWNMGPKKIPSEIKVTKAEGDSTQAQPEEAKLEEVKTGEENSQQEESKASSTMQEEEKKDEEDAEDQIIIEEGPKVSQEDMDARIIEAFYRSILESIKDSDLPIEPSDLQKDHLSLYLAHEGYKLDLRLSSFKRIGKLLEIMHKKGIIEYSEVKGVAHKLVTRVFRDVEELKNYTMKYSLKKVKKAAVPQSTGGDGVGEGYPKVQIEEIYEPTKHLNCVLGAIKDHQLQQYYSLKDLRDLLSLYIKQNELDLRKGLIKVDPILAQLLSPGQYNSQNEANKDVVLKAVPQHVKECYQVTQLDEEEVIKSRSKTFKGSVPKVVIKAQRVANKKVTVVTGLELWQIGYDEVLPLFSVKCAGSSTLHEASHGAKGMEVQVQGEHIDTITDLLVKKYKVPIKYIEQINNIESKKKKK